MYIWYNFSGSQLLSISCFNFTMSWFSSFRFTHCSYFFWDDLRF